MRLLLFLVLSLLALTMAQSFVPSDTSDAALGPQLQPWRPESDFKV